MSKWNLTYTSSGDFKDPTSHLYWQSGDTVEVDEEVKVRLFDHGPHGFNQPSWIAEPVVDTVQGDQEVETQLDQKTARRRGPVDIEVPPVPEPPTGEGG